jgi:GNAT superfamily N-acetyltransferase
MDDGFREQIHQRLRSDEIWCAYALADLDPAEDTWSRWHIHDEAVRLCYHGLTPPILFLHGSQQTIPPLMAFLPNGVHQFTLRQAHRALLTARMKPLKEQAMWRMALEEAHLPTARPGKTRRLNASHLPAIKALFGEHPDRPDSFHPRQLEAAPFYGIFEGEALVSMSGVHIMSGWARVAAIGNVFTHPGRRRLGYAAQVCAATLRALLHENIETIVLNVSKDNLPAIRCYQRLGFRAYCDYQEGVGEIKSPS